MPSEALSSCSTLTLLATKPPNERHEDGRWRPPLQTTRSSILDRGRASNITPRSLLFLWHRCHIIGNSKRCPSP